MMRAMGRIHFTANLQRHVAAPSADVHGATVAAALDAVFADHPRLRSYIVDEQGRLRQHVNVYVNDEAVRDRVRLSDPVAAADEIFVFQALSGG